MVTFSQREYGFTKENVSEPWDPVLLDRLIAPFLGELFRLFLRISSFHSESLCSVEGDHDHSSGTRKPDLLFISLDTLGEKEFCPRIAQRDRHVADVSSLARSMFPLVLVHLFPERASQRVSRGSEAALILPEKRDTRSAIESKRA
jgi:hypothetical protein